MTHYLRFWDCLLPGVVAATAAIIGCGGANFASELSRKPTPRVVADVQPLTISLPSPRAFSIVTRDASHHADLGGTAEADAHAVKDGSADATARVSRGGQATASFQLGDSFRNDTQRQMDLQVSVQLKYEFTTEAPPRTAPVEGTVGLKLYASDKAGRLTRNETLISHAVEDGATTRSGDSVLGFTLTLGPGDTANIFLAGQADVQADYGRSAACSLKISDVRMEVTTRPAPAVRTTGDERG